MEIVSKLCVKAHSKTLPIAFSRGWVCNNGCCSRLKEATDTLRLQFQVGDKEMPEDKEDEEAGDPNRS